MSQAPSILESPPGALTPARSGMPLRWRLVLLVVASILPFLIFTLGSRYFEYRSDVEQASGQALTMARSLSLALQEELQARITTLEKLAESNALKSGDLVAFRARTEALVHTQFPGATIALLTEDGQHVLDAALPPDAPLSVRTDLDSLRQAATSRRPALSNLYQNATTRRPVISIDLPVVSSDGTIIYFLSLSADVEVFADFIRRQHMPEGWDVSVFDSRNIGVVRIPNDERFTGREAAPGLVGPPGQQEGVVDSVSFDGAPLLSAFSHVPLFGWTVAVDIPRKELTGPALKEALYNIAAGCVIFVLSLVMALYAGHRITKPIESLRRFAAASGGTAAPASTPTGVPEVDEVAETLRAAEDRRQRSQKALFDSEARLKQAQRLAQIGSVVWNIQTGETEWSDELYRIFGLTRGQVAPSVDEYMSMVHSEDAARVAADLEKRWGDVLPPIDYRIVRPDGSVRQVHRETEVIDDEAGNPHYLVATIQDVTEQRRTEEQLRQSQKMEAIGNLTGGMAHDFNNLLGVVVGNLDLARERLTNDAESCEMIDDALNAAMRGADLTRRLLAFARRQPLRPERIEVNELVTDASKLLRRLLGEDVEVTLKPGKDIWPIIADSAQLESALANLATNARDAMPKGGRLIIGTGNRRLDADYVAMHPDVTEGDYALIEVSDTGSGMSPEIMSKIFEPFFTTKELGKGTGLGLSMVFGFLRQSGGHVSVYSELGVGTTFRLYLPRTMTEEAANDVIDTQPVARGDGETVLVVEDNDSVRRIVLRSLHELGYHILESDRAAAALEMLENEKVDLLLTDIVMPGGMDGVELARTARKRWPKLKIVLTSGFPQARVDGNVEALDGLHLLSKPYRKQELAAALRAALDG